MHKHFEKGQQFELGMLLYTILKEDKGVHLNSTVIEVRGKRTVIDNISIYGNIILINECKNYTYIEDTGSRWWKGRGTGKQFGMLSPIEQVNYQRVLLSNYLTSKGIPHQSINIIPRVVVPDNCELKIPQNILYNFSTESQMRDLKSKLSRDCIDTNSKLISVLKGD